MSDRDDLFGDDDDFEFDDDLFGDDDFDADDLGADDSTDDFSFDDDDGFDDDFDDIGFGDEDDDFFDDEEEEEEAGGTSRTFIVLAAMMILLFVVALVAVLFLALGGEEEQTPFDMTSVAIASTNDAIFTEVAQNETDVFIQNSTATIIALTEQFEGTQQALTAEASATALALTLVADGTQQALDATASAEALIVQQTIDAADTLTAEAVGLEVTEPVVVETEVPIVTEGIATSSISEVQLTATALAEQFLALTPSGDATPTREFGTGGFSTPVPGQLPETGLFDDPSSASNLGMLALMAFGLVGVIFGARRLRATNNEQT